MRTFARTPARLFIELVMALLLALATILSDGLVADACEAQLPAVETLILPLQTEPTGERAC